MAYFTSENFDPLGMRILTGEIYCGGAMLRFDSDFAMPALPEVE